MKIAIVYNRESRAVINLFGVPNRERYGLRTIQEIQEALETGGHQVRAFEGDKNIIRALEEFMSAVIAGERPGLVFNLSYGIQGRARYTHIPSILEMVGVPYVGSGPQTHAIALDKVVTKVLLQHRGLPTPRFAVLQTPEEPLPGDLPFPLIVKPKDEAASFGLRIVRTEGELREASRAIHGSYAQPTLVEEFIEGREVNVALLGNDPVEALPPLELRFPEEGEPIYTYEDKTGRSGRQVEKLCPAPIPAEQAEEVRSLAISTFKALGCFDSARVDFRLDRDGNPYILEVNSMASLGPEGSLVHAARAVGLDYTALVNRLIEIASARYFGDRTPGALLQGPGSEEERRIFSFVTEGRDQVEDELQRWTNLPSWTDDPVGLATVMRRMSRRIEELGLREVPEFTNRRSTWMWETAVGLEGGTLLVVPVDLPREPGGGYPVPFRREPEWLHGEGIASSRAGLVAVLTALGALRQVDRIEGTRAGVFLYADEGRGMRYSAPTLRRAAARAGEVLVLQPGAIGGRVVDQRRGSRRLSILAEGPSLRIGARGGRRDVLTWFLERSEEVVALSRREELVAAAVQDLHSERFSMLLPHRLRATIYVTFVDPDTADDAEDRIREILHLEEGDELRAFVERLEERPSLPRSSRARPVLDRLERLSEEWHLPFGTDSGLLPSAAGVVPEDVPVVCGCGPASQGLHTPSEAVHRGELIQRILLLALHLLGTARA